MPRKNFTEKTKCLIRERAGHACERCGTADGPFDVNHMHDCWTGGGNDPGNGEYLCKPCHAVETKRQAEARAKAKRIAAGGRKRKGAPIQSRGFPSKEERKRLRERYGQG